MELKKVVVAPDSFKGSLSAAEVARAAEDGIRDVFPDCGVVRIPIADGGEGTVEALVAGMDGRYVEAMVSDPLMRPVRAVYGVIGQGSTAVIEMASASGLPLLTVPERNPLETTTFGTGELIRDALSRGCRKFLVGIGGSATNDAGTGMLQALGYKFLDTQGNVLGRGGKILGEIAAIDDSQVVAALKESTFVVACDVTNPLYGENGAAFVFAPQKGADAATVRTLDEGLRRFAAVTKIHTGCEVGELPGAGAAGGLGAAFRAFLRARLTPGIEMVLDAVGFRAQLAGADLVLTGEGKLDAQTVMGKAPQGVLEAASAAGIPVIAIGGAVEDAQRLNEAGFTAVFPIIHGIADAETAMRPDVAAANIRRTVGQIARTIYRFSL